MDWRKEVDKFLKRWGGFLIKNISETTRKQTIAVISEVYAEQVGADKVAREVYKRLGVYSRARSSKIARTEVVRASNAGTYIGGMEVEDLDRKEWIAVIDDRTRDSHTAADGQIVPKADKFTVGGHECDHPGSAELPAGESIQCRCAIGFLVEGEEGRAYDERRSLFRKTEKTRLQYQKWATRHAKTMLDTIADDVAKAIDGKESESAAVKAATKAVKKGEKYVREMLETIYGRVIPDFGKDVIDRHEQRGVVQIVVARFERQYEALIERHGEGVKTMTFRELKERGWI